MTVPHDRPLTRTYGGRTAEQRAAERRRAFLDAGLELFGTIGYANTRVRAVCRQAGLSERYFYESFPDLESLLTAVYLGVCEDVATTVLAQLADVDDDLETQARVGMLAFAHATVTDPRRARVQLLEAVAVSGQLERTRRQVLHRFAAIVATRLQPVAHAGLDPQLLAMAVVGGVNELLIDHVLGLDDAPLERLVEHFVALALAVGRAADGSGSPQPSA